MPANAAELVALEALRERLVEATADEAWRRAEPTLISGGKSNLTFLVSSPAGELVLRRPPTGDLLPSAHDMGREARVQRALAGTDVPVAQILLIDEGGLVGRPCYVMEKVPGHIVRGDLPPAYADTPDRRRAMAEAFVDVLADLHAVDYQAVGLGDYGRPDGFLERQVRRWTGQWEKSRSHDVPEIDELARRLAASIPVQQRSAIAHGDYRFDNVVFAPDEPGRINAVLDWELSTIGDPLADVGLLMLFWREPGEEFPPLIPGVTNLPGFPTRAEILERYAARSGADLSVLDPYIAFAHFKFAVIAQGVAARSAAGAMGGQDFGNLDAEIRRLATEGLELL
ncbi:phosphotransferase family protein [Nocardioides daejeonensis]|uniref:phosphotransferase family protein n=1 Tax=Nocardioides daejeonensis TaxID=1046556 RepID=UPI000D74241F|nr:phosphotransferase family protein [Nocardioides daejeonensis]